jgi:hypothetical protein
MTPLPQHKKSPGEIARLRKSLGVPEDAAMAPDDTDMATNNTGAEPVDTDTAGNPQDSPLPLPVADSYGPSTDNSQPVMAAPVHHHRPLQPLKRSGGVPAPFPAPSRMAVASDGELPLRRHSDGELAEARRRDALAVISQGAYQMPRAAHPALLALGYVLAIGGAAAPALLDNISRMTGSFTLGGAFSGGYHLLSIGTLAALPVAAFIYFRKPLSHHHSAFIAIIAFIALVFASLHYFPLLRNAT